MTSKKLSQHKQDFADAMSTKLRLNKAKLYGTLSPEEKINQLTAEQRELIGEFRLLIIIDGLKEFPDLHPLYSLQMMEEFRG